MPPRYWMVEISSLRESESHVESASRVRVTKGREWISSATRRQRTPGSWNARRGSSDPGAWQGAFPQQLSRLAVEGSYLAVVVCCRNEPQAASRYYRTAVVFATCWWHPLSRQFGIFAQPDFEQVLTCV